MGKKDERAEQNGGTRRRDGRENREEACVQACSVTSNETFILALLALLRSANRPRVRNVRIESCTLSYFRQEIGPIILFTFCCNIDVYVMVLISHMYICVYVHNNIYMYIISRRRERYYIIQQSLVFIALLLITLQRFILNRILLAIKNSTYISCVIYEVVLSISRYANVISRKRARSFFIFVFST